MKLLQSYTFPYLESSASPQRLCELIRLRQPYSNLHLHGKNIAVALQQCLRLACRYIMVALQLCLQEACFFHKGKEAYKSSFFPQTIRDWNDLPDSLVSSAEMSDDCVSKFASLVRSRD